MAQHNADRMDLQLLSLSQRSLHPPAWSPGCSDVAMDWPPRAHCCSSVSHTRQGVFRCKLLPDVKDDPTSFSFVHSKVAWTNGGLPNGIPLVGWCRVDVTFYTGLEDQLNLLSHCNNSSTFSGGSASFPGYQWLRDDSGSSQILCILVQECIKHIATVQVHSDHSVHPKEESDMKFRNHMRIT